MSTTAILNSVSKRQRLAASPARVFRAWTSGDDLMAWWRPGRFRAESVAIDLRVGGTYEIVMVDPNGARQRVSGVYLEIENAKRLAMTWRLEGSSIDDGYDALLSLNFIGDGDGTLLELTHEKLRPDGVSRFDDGWERLLPNLGRHVLPEQDR